MPKSPAGRSTASTSVPIETKQDINTVTFLKGVAIMAVIFLHVLANLKGHIFTTHPWHAGFIFLDQVNRFCVPLFVALSGYALTRKYWGQEISPWEFFTRRALKLLPLYLIWSLGLVFILSYEPMWTDPTNHYTFLEKLIYGHADYQLYFVPMIFQLYVLFPFLLKLLRKQPLGLLIATLIIQSGVLVASYLMMTKQLSWSFFLTDQQQYSFSLSWIFYFVLGMIVAEKINIKRIQTNWKLIGAGAVVTSLVGLYWAMGSALSDLAKGVDPIIFLKFTRFPIMAYASGVVAASLIFKKIILILPTGIQKVGVYLGAESYLLYLGHTLVLRIIFSIGQGVPTSSLVLATGLVVALTALSKVVEKRI